MFSELLGAAPAITRLTKATPAFAEASTISLKSLGDAAEVAGPNIRDSDPVVVQLRNLASVAQSPSRNLRQLLFTLRKTGGYKALMKFILHGATTLNGFDKFGHYQRTNILVSGLHRVRADLSRRAAALSSGPERRASTPPAGRRCSAASAIVESQRWHAGGSRPQRQR